MVTKSKSERPRFLENHFAKWLLARTASELLLVDLTQARPQLSLRVPLSPRMEEIPLGRPQELARVARERLLYFAAVLSEMEWEEVETPDIRNGQGLWRPRTHPPS